MELRTSHSRKERLATKTVTKPQLIFGKFDIAQLADGSVRS
jgi:hypothetical protein